MCWSESILQELSRNVVADDQQLGLVRFSEHALGEMRKHFPEAMANAQNRNKPTQGLIKRDYQILGGRSHRVWAE